MTYERLFICRAWYRKLDTVNLRDIKRNRPSLTGRVVLRNAVAAAME